MYISNQTILEKPATAQISASVRKLESLIRQEKKASHEKSLKPMSMNEFNEMIDQAKRDSEAGRVISHQELKKKVKSWK